MLQYLLALAFASSIPLVNVGYVAVGVASQTALPLIIALGLDSPTMHKFYNSSLVAEASHRLGSLTNQADRILPDMQNFYLQTSKAVTNCVDAGSSVYYYFYPKPLTHRLFDFVVNRADDYTEPSFIMFWAALFFAFLCLLLCIIKWCCERIDRNSRIPYYGMPDAAGSYPDVRRFCDTVLSGSAAMWSAQNYAASDLNNRAKRRDFKSVTVIHPMDLIDDIMSKMESDMDAMEVSGVPLYHAYRRQVVYFASLELRQSSSDLISQPSTQTSARCQERLVTALTKPNERPNQTLLNQEMGRRLGEAILRAPGTGRLGVTWR